MRGLIGKIGKAMAASGNAPRTSWALKWKVLWNSVPHQQHDDTCQRDDAKNYGQRAVRPIEADCTCAIMDPPLKKTA